MPEIDAALAQIKSSLDELSKDVSQGKYPAPILKDFKLTVDALRLTIWAIIEFEEQSRKEAHGARFGLSTKIAEFRVKRLVQMLTDLRADIEKGGIAPKTLDLKPLSAALKTTLQSITGLGPNPI